jgi:tRNA(adenine34) deaminase
MGEVPVGAVIVKDGEVIATAHNLRENGGGATAHAELLAINEACEVLGSWRLSGCELYVTLEPCPMCAGAIINSRLDRVIFGAKDPRMGALGSLINLNDYPLGYKVKITEGVLAEESLRLMSDFFKERRIK